MRFLTQLLGRLSMKNRSQPDANEASAEDAIAHLLAEMQEFDIACRERVFSARYEWQTGNAKDILTLLEQEGYLQKAREQYLTENCCGHRGAKHVAQHISIKTEYAYEGGGFARVAGESASLYLDGWTTHDSHGDATFYSRILCVLRVAGQRYCYSIREDQKSDSS